MRKDERIEYKRMKKEKKKKKWKKIDVLLSFSFLFYLTAENFL